MINLEWVADYINIEDYDPKELALQITRQGINVEKVISNHIDNLVIGEVIECIDHPNSDHLHICKVNIGKEIIQIVCGAPNVRKNLKVVVALPGCFLPNGISIKKGVIRGVESNGMICALFELGLEDKTEENYNKGIYEVIDDVEIGSDASLYLGLSSTLLELDVHKHRNNDCYSHIGFAYEIGAVINRKVTLPESNYTEIKENIKDNFELEVKTKKCPFYLAKMVKDIVIKESPDFIKKRLAEAGIRSINNVVDISNYVMLEYGQPLHFFDKDLLGNKIVVRDALENEEIVTLDGIKRTLKSSDIVITDKEKPVAVAGVMGGENTEINDNTKNVLIESAIFDPVSIRYTSKNLNLKSEASIRYGKGLNYEYTIKALDRACYLLEKYASGKVLSGTLDYDILDKTKKVVTFTGNDIKKMLGIEISIDDICLELEKLDMDYVLDNDKFTVTIPNRRLDIEPYVNDIAEEIGRLYGFDKIENKLPILPIKKGSYSSRTLFRKQVSKRLRALSLNEVKTYTLISKKEEEMFNDEEGIALLMPMSIDKSIIRTSIVSSLYEKTYKYNKKRNINNINIYEIANVYHKDYQEELKLGILMKGEYLSCSWQDNTIYDNFFVLKGIIENLLNYMGYPNRICFKKIKKPYKEIHPSICADILVDNEVVGYLGKINPVIEQDDVFVSEISLEKLYNKTPSKIKYKEASKYPEIKKDVAFIASDEITCEEIEQAIKKSGTSLLKNIYLFDLYKGEGIDNNKKSLAYSLTFSDDTKTLTEKEVDTIFRNIIKYVCDTLSIEIRDK